jgi:ubiquinol-cytochrome c reductase cytochrome b subunit
VSLNDVTYWLRALFFVGPIIAFVVTKRIALGLQRKDREIALHGRETGRIVRLPHGEFIEVHAPLDEYKRYRLVSFDSPEILPAQPNGKGVVDRRERRRAKLSKWFFEDRVAPVSPAELEAAHAHGHHEAIESASTTSGH